MKQNLIFFLMTSALIISTASCGKDKVEPNLSSSLQTEERPTDREPVVPPVQQPKNVRVDDLIGAKLTEYPGYEAVNDDFTRSLFANRSQIIDSNAKLPIYRIEVDRSSLDHAVKKLIHKFALDQKSSEGEVTTYASNDRMLQVNHQTGTLDYYDLQIFHKGEGVDSIDKPKILENAQKLFEEVVPSDMLSKTYFYRYDEYINSASVNDEQLPDKIYQVGVGLNSTVGGIPIIGSGGKFGIHLKPDGEIAAVDMQFVRFVESGDVVQLQDSTSALAEVKAKAEKENGVDFEKYSVSRTEFGYFYQSKKSAVQWLVPSYTVFVAPNKGEIGSGTYYFVPASKDTIANERFDEDVRLEETRKAFKYENEEKPVPDLRKPDPGFSP